MSTLSGSLVCITTNRSYNISNWQMLTRYTPCTRCTIYCYITSCIPGSTNCRFLTCLFCTITILISSNWSLYPLNSKRLSYIRNIFDLISNLALYSFVSSFFEKIKVAKFKILFVYIIVIAKLSGPFVVKSRYGLYIDIFISNIFI